MINQNSFDYDEVENQDERTSLVKEGSVEDDERIFSLRGKDEENVGLAGEEMMYSSFAILASYFLLHCLTWSRHLACISLNLLRLCDCRLTS